MAGKPSKLSEAGAQYLLQNPTASAIKVAENCGLTVSAVQKSVWWKNRANKPQKVQK